MHDTGKEYIYTTHCFACCLKSYKIEWTLLIAICGLLKSFRLEGIKQIEKEKAKFKT